MSPSLSRANFFSYNPFVRLACVASVSNRVIAGKLEREQKKKWKGKGEGKRFLLSLPPPPSFLFFALDKLARKRSLRRLLFAQPGQLGQSETIKTSWLGQRDQLVSEINAH